MIEEVAWDIKPGEYLTREDRRVRFGALFTVVLNLQQEQTIFSFTQTLREGRVTDTNLMVGILINLFISTLGKAGSEIKNLRMEIERSQNI